MSKAKPTGLHRRLENYIGLGLSGNYHDSQGRRFTEADLTPAQRRRAWHKAHRSGERGGPGKGEELYGRKGRPTPRQRKRASDG